MIVSYLIFWLMLRGNRNFSGCFDSVHKPWSRSHISCSFFTNSLLPLIPLCLCSCTDFFFFSWAVYITQYNLFLNITQHISQNAALVEFTCAKETCRWTVIFTRTTNAHIYMYLNTYMEIRNCRKWSVKVYNLRKFQQAVLQQAIANKTLGWTLSHTEFYL